jgi:hypothetical protein
MNTFDKCFVEEWGELQAMLAWQADLTSLLFDNAVLPVEYASSEHVREILTCLVVEATEALAPFLTSLKPWKSRLPDMKLVDEEVIDVLHYILTYFQLRGYGARKITELYREKNLRNGDRARATMIPPARNFDSWPDEDGVMVLESGLIGDKEI